MGRTSRFSDEQKLEIVLELLADKVSHEYDSFAEVHKAIEDYVKYYNGERIHSALDYKTPNEVAAAFNTLVAA